MQSIDIVKRLKEFVPKFTNVFNNGGTVSSLAASAGIINANIPSHNLTNSDFYTFSGAYEPLSNTSITRENNIITVLCSEDHKQIKLTSGEERYIKIANATPSDYNGDFKLLQIVDKFTLRCEILTTPASPATASGNILYLSPAYNGLKEITVVDSDNITYTTDDTDLNSPAQGTITYSNTNAGYGANFDLCLAQYKKISNQSNYSHVLYVTIYNSQTYDYKNITTQDPTGIHNQISTGFILNELTPFSIYMIIPKINSEIGGKTTDEARRLESVIHASVLGYQFTRLDTSFTAQGKENRKFYPVCFTGTEGAFDGSNRAFYIHKMNYIVKSQLNYEYTTDYFRIAPLNSISGTFNQADFEATTR